MTRTEVQEDLSIGAEVALKTTDGGLYEGVIENFGESGLKISIQGIGKRILYGAIVEYDIRGAAKISPNQKSPNAEDFGPDNFTVDSDAILERNKGKLAKEELGLYIA